MLYFGFFLPQMYMCIIYTMINDFGDVNYSQNCRNFYVHCPFHSFMLLREWREQERKIESELRNCPTKTYSTCYIITI